MAAISSGQTRAIAGASSSSYFAATSASTPSSTASARADARGGHRQTAGVRIARKNSACISWKIAPFVSGSSRCSGSGSWFGSSR